uniref:Prospero domain-containing protein n=1 Tax=Globodera pallida TaxID=36090 RepID=A0A183C5B2_GLOPA
MSSSLGNEHNNALNDDKLTYNNGLHTFDQQQQQQQNRRSENRDDVDGGGEPDDHGDEDRMEQIEDEDLLFPPSLVCWSRPTQTARKSTVPTMVPSVEPHARLLAFRCTGKSSIGGGAGGIPEVSSGDELAVPISPHRTTLTHMHLRKAKLMFFYQRYPSSSLLKSYFPDVHFTKHNTAQLVKWFSNFREFFYMQMEKFAKQALAEGVKRADEIYAPERLLLVIEETLREFFNALKQGRDVEPSWKKAIYKVIQQLDEPIPEFFREPQFVELLEQN